MIKILLLFCTITFLVASCDSKESTYSAISNGDTLVEVAVKNDPTVLIAQAKSFLLAKDYTNAKQRIGLLNNEFINSPENEEGQKLLILINEEEDWNHALASANSYYTASYLTNYPKGKYSTLAKQRFKELKSQKEKEDYAYALSQNSSSTWKAFIEDYPSRKDIKDIKKRIIRAEVDEIMNRQETGEIPSSYQTNSGYSPTSTVSIKNDTECELTVRYSGADAKMIEIPVGGTRSLSLSSGDYKIAASACGYHYAGTESLQGRYSSKYYIVTSRY